MLAHRLTLGKVVVGWAVFFIGAALVLPPLDSHAPISPALKLFILVVSALLVVGTPVATFRYFNEQWRRASAVPNRTPYVLWLSLETTAAVVCFGWLAWVFLRRA